MAQAGAVPNDLNAAENSSPAELAAQQADGRPPVVADNVLEVTNLRKYFPILRGFFRRPRSAK